MRFWTLSKVYEGGHILPTTVDFEISFWVLNKKDMSNFTELLIVFEAHSSNFVGMLDCGHIVIKGYRHSYIF